MRNRITGLAVHGDRLSVHTATAEHGVEVGPALAESVLAEIAPLLLAEPAPVSLKQPESRAGQWLPTTEP
jgi:hypothetical protein